MKLIDLAKILRSKNAGPLYITFDVMFDSSEKMERALLGLTRDKVAQAYGVGENEIDIIPYKIVNSIKITFPRKHISGDVFDDDVYGCQQHVPLSEIEV